jgi:hypothetical protein
MITDLSARNPNWHDMFVAGSGGILDGPCFDGTDGDIPACTQSLQDAMLVATISNRVALALSRLGDNIIDQEAKFMARYNAGWQAYFNDARSQTPLELLINNYAFVHSAAFTHPAEPAVAALADPPTHQFIFLHPRAGFEYVGGASPGSRFKPAAFMEVAGYNLWGYDSDGKMGNAFGASLMASYSDRAGAKAIGYGAMFYFKTKYALGLTYRKSSTIGIMVSADLQSAIIKYSDATQTAVRSGTYGH